MCSYERRLLLLFHLRGCVLLADVLLSALVTPGDALLGLVVPQVPSPFVHECEHILWDAVEEA